MSSIYKKFKFTKCMKIIFSLIITDIFPSIQIILYFSIYMETVFYKEQSVKFTIVSDSKKRKWTSLTSFNPLWYTISNYGFFLSSPLVSTKKTKKISDSNNSFYSGCQKLQCLLGLTTPNNAPDFYDCFV